MKKIAGLSLIGFSLCLTGCGVFHRSPTVKMAKVPTYKPSIVLKKNWQTTVGRGSERQYLQLTPAITRNHIYVANYSGTVVALSRQTGKRLWHYNTHFPLTSGVGLGDGLVVVGSHRGQVFALRQSDGHPVWRANVPGEVIAAPAVARGRVVVKAQDGQVIALSAKTGATLWTHVQKNPGLILRASSAPVIKNNRVLVGFASGELLALSLPNGQVLWSTQLASAHGNSPVQRMVDVDDTPVVKGQMVYAATYRGVVAAVNLKDGNIKWKHPVSSYAGLAVGPKHVYVTDADSAVIAFGRYTGIRLWKQKKLYGRSLSGPAVLGQHLVVGDLKGYLHWFSTRTGKLEASTHFAGSSVIAPPEANRGHLYALSSSGELVSYQVG